MESFDLLSEVRCREVDGPAHLTESDQAGFVARGLALCSFCSCDDCLGVDQRFASPWRECLFVFRVYGGRPGVRSSCSTRCNTTSSRWAGCGVGEEASQGRQRGQRTWCEESVLCTPCVSRSLFARGSVRAIPHRVMQLDDDHPTGLQPILVCVHVCSLAAK